MNCEWAKSNLTLFVYEELPDDLRYELERHLERCPDCTEELNSLRQFHEAMSALPRPDADPNLLAAARIRLSEALEETEQNYGWRLLDPVAWLRQIRFSPALASVLLIAGFAGGVGTTWRMAANPGTGPVAVSTANVQPVQASISGIRSITQLPNTNQVEISYDTVVPQKVEGSLQDQRIQQLLLFAARSNSNSGVRMDSVDLLTQNPHDLRIREALKSALLYDSNPGVRLRALESLGTFITQDISVRDAVLQALESDHNPGVRAQAIHMLQPVRVDGSVRVVLQRLSREDQSQFIREQSRMMLATLPEID
ncbi:MAG: HEAT repeat domain-containing protein [Candidatus Korobacteraceae bacterium]